MKRIFLGFLTLWTLVLLMTWPAHAQNKKLEFIDGKWVAVPVASTEYYPLHFTVVVFSYTSNRTCSAELKDQFNGLYSVTQEGFRCFILSSGDKYDGKVARVHGMDAAFGQRDRLILDLHSVAGKAVGYSLWNETH